MFDFDQKPLNCFGEKELFLVKFEYFRKNCVYLRSTTIICLNSCRQSVDDCTDSLLPGESFYKMRKNYLSNLLTNKNYV